MEKMVIGFIRSPWGVQGKIKAESTSGETEHFLELKEVTVRKDGVKKTLSVESAEASGSGLILKFTGIDSPEAVKKYASWEIVVPRDMACPLDEDEFYVTDLCQCTLIYRESPEKEPVNVGVITGVLEGGAGDLLEVMPAEGCVSADGDAGAKRNTVIIPFRKEFIGDVDMEKRTVQLMHLWVLES